MQRHRLVTATRLSLSLVAFLSGSLAARNDASRQLVDPARARADDLVDSTDATAEWTAAGALTVRTGTRHTWPGVTIRAPEGNWDLSAFGAVVADVRNVGVERITLRCRVDNPGTDGRKKCANGQVRLNPGESGTLHVRLCPTPWNLTRPLKLIGMRAAPGPLESFDVSRVTQLLFFLARPQKEHHFEVSNIRATGRVNMLDAEKFMPFIDELGQFIHADWPGKLRSVEEFPERIEAEHRDLEAHPSPPDRNRYGGWTRGPELEATGFFRVEKVRGKWWLVDPDGRLFWSHGADCVRASIATPISAREHYFRGLPEKESPFAAFYGRGSWAPHGYYAEHGPYRSFDFGRANLRRKYGEDWAQKFANVSHRRLRSWGLNTIANWSDSSIYRLRRTPYVATVNFRSRPIEGSTGYWGKFLDVFDAGFRAALRARMEAERGRSAGDPWCIGYFVHNELGWGDELSLALASLASPADQPAKRTFVAILRTKYGEIAKLNANWGTTHSSWDALLETTATPDRDRAREDLASFYTKVAETYFEVIREEVKRVAPRQLYLGCRFAWVNDRAARAGARYCDVVSYNRYAYSVADLRLPEGVDKPVVIGEFHFGALDRGMFHTGLRVAENQDDRAAKYRSYVEGALRHPHIVGTHWFTYRDQATTGRGDGENYQIGFVDVCDTPYPEMIGVLRQLGRDLYTIRVGD